MGGGLFAAVSNKTRHLNLLADWRAAATMKTSRDNRLRMKHLHLFIIKKLTVETVKAVQQENQHLQNQSNKDHKTLSFKSVPQT